MTCAMLLAAVIVGTWNGEWFPSGRAEHRAPDAVEAATTRKAGELLARGLKAVDPQGTNDVILCLNEIRGPHAASNLVAQIGRAGLRVVAISGYRRRDRFDMQQDVIATTLPVAGCHWSKWKTFRKVFLPRGYVHADIIISPTVTASVYAVHLKSNYGQTTEEIAQTNRLKRTAAIEQLLAAEGVSGGSRRRRAANRPLMRPTIVAGDFNADKWDENFAAESIFSLFENARFDNVMEALPPARRITHPGRGKWRNATFDYVMVRGLKVREPGVVLSADGLSDHNPVFTVLEESASMKLETPTDQEKPPRRRRRKSKRASQDVANEKPVQNEEMK